LIAIFAVYHNNLHSLTKYRISYYFYPIEKHKKLIFIHRSLDTIIVINTIKLNQILDKIKVDRASRKDEESNGYDIVDICEVYYTPQLILDGIQSDLNIDLKEAHLDIIGHFFDKKNYIIYFIANIVQQDIKITVLLSCNCLSDKIRFKLVCYYDSVKENVAIKVPTCSSQNLKKHLLSMGNIDLYGVASNCDGIGKFDSLYLSINCSPFHLYTSYLVDIRYNRFSYKLYQGKIKLRISRIGNIILMEYKSSPFSRENDDDIDVESSFCFILSQLNLVEVMRHFVV